MEPFVGQIQLFGFPWAPRGWALCNGQLLAISSNTALFSLLGTTYGGNGQTTFALPNLQGRVAIGQGQGPGLSNHYIGEIGGEEHHTLIITEMPAHNHVATSVLNVNAGDANVHTPVAGNSIGGVMDINGDPSNGFVATNPTIQLNNGSVVSTIGIAGGSQPHNNMQPYLAMNYCIALEGVYPSRN